jgi:hypothetical protein
LAFCISIAVTGGPPASASGSPHSTGPMRDWSMMRVRDRSGRGRAPGEIEAPMVEAQEEGAAALVLPGAGHRRQAGDGVHRGRAVARAGEAEAQPQEAALGAAVEAGEVDDLVDAEPGDGARPFRRLVGEMRLDVGAEVGVLARYARSTRPSFSSTFIMASASAPSVPGRSTSPISAASMVGVR